MRRTRWTRGIPGALVVAAVVAGGCTVDDGWRSERAPRPLPAADEVRELRAAGGCEELVERARPILEDGVELAWGAAPDGAEQGDADGASAFDGAGSAERSAPMADAAAPVDATAGGTEELVGTNDQEAGVREADLVDTDGTNLVWIAGGQLQVARLDDDVRVDGRLEVAARGARRLYLRGDRVLLLGTTYGGVATPVPLPGPDVGVAFDGGADGAVRGATEPGSAGAAEELPATSSTTTTEPPAGEPPTSAPPTTAPTTTTPLAPAPFEVGTTLTLVSIEDPAEPRVVASADVEGELVAARRIDGTTRLVLRSTPTVARELWRAPDRASALEAVRAVDAEALVPRFAVAGAVAPLTSCGDVLVDASPTAAAPSPGGSAGGAGDLAAIDLAVAPAPELTTITVLRVGEDLDDLAPTTVQGLADTVYASTDALYVAAGSWDRAGSRTDVHRFDLRGDGPATYTGSGRVPGRLLNQFAMSEHAGVLRVATTVDGSAAPVAEERMAVEPVPVDGGTEGRVTVLDTDGTLDELGAVDGLGVGEEVQSVRFMGDVGYVVTFRRTDPLYALDLSDPRAPRVTGELKVTGFSEYLHPVGDGLLLGVGREADPATGMDEGFKVSLFDVSDPARLEEVDRFVLPEAWSEVASDHLAFTWDPRRAQAIFPAGASALVVRVTDGRLERVGELVHRGPWGAIAPTRSRIVDGTIWTVSEVALGATPADRPDRVDLVPAS